MTSSSKFSVRLFYSYCHKDERHRDRMEKALTLLRSQGLLDDWSDNQIPAGHNIPQAVEDRIRTSDICVFLLSHDFLASEPCREEWRLAGTSPWITRVPVILSDCAWKDVDGMPDLKALPKDARPVTSFGKRDEAWNDVYNGLKQLIERLRENFAVRSDFREQMERTEFPSQERVGLPGIFVFPRLSHITTDVDNLSETIADRRQLLNSKYLLIHGEELSGKSGLCKHLFLSLVDEGTPVIFIDLDNVRQRATADIFREAYNQQFHGDYSLWSKRNDKVVIMDNLAPRSINYVLLAMQHFSQVILTVPTDTFIAYYKDDDRLKDFDEFNILPLTHSMQEVLIRKRARLLEGQILDGHIDQMENRVNTIIINNRILPRYPFYVLSILQTYERFMPANLSITSHGHCYHILIFSYLMKSGIAKSDDEINAAMNFLEHLSFRIWQVDSSEQIIGPEALADFLKEYKKEYIIKESTLNRLSGQDYGVINSSGGFKNPYMYYFFLGKFLADNLEAHVSTIQGMLDNNHVTSNCLILMFIIHHTNDEQLIDDILLRTMTALETVRPATLDESEATLFEDIAKSLPENIVSSTNVKTERERERNRRDRTEEFGAQDIESSDDETNNRDNEAYRILKNNEILGHILRNKYGSLKRDRISEIIEAIGDGGLRLVGLLLSKEAINDHAAYVHSRHPEYDLNTIRGVMRLITFVWTMQNVEKIVWELNKPEVRPLIEEVVRERNTPAYDLIGYFLRLDTIPQFLERDHDVLRMLWTKHHYPFFQRVISIRTQWYLNTHQVREPIEQAVCSLLNIRYRARPKAIK